MMHLITTVSRPKVNEAQYASRVARDKGDAPLRWRHHPPHPLSNRNLNLVHRGYWFGWFFRQRPCHGATGGNHKPHKQPGRYQPYAR